MRDDERMMVVRRNRRPKRHEEHVERGRTHLPRFQQEPAPDLELRPVQNRITQEVLDLVQPEWLKATRLRLDLEKRLRKQREVRRYLFGFCGR